MANLTRQDIEVHLRHFRQEEPEGRVYAIHFDGQPPVSEITVGDDDWQVEYAPSELALRMLLAERSSERPMAIFTPLRNNLIPEDVEARLAGEEIYQLDPWASLATLFEASSVDAALRWGDYSREFARALLRCIPADRVTPVAGGLLDADTAWRGFQRYGLDQGEPAVELTDWLLWAVESPSAVDRLFDSYEDVYEPLAERLHNEIGPSGRVFLEILRSTAGRNETNPGVEVLSIGLVYRATMRAEEMGDVKTAMKVQAQLESPKFGAFDRDPSADEMGALSVESVRTWEKLAALEKAGQYRAAIQNRVDEILERTSPNDAETIARHSRVSRHGWDSHLHQFAEAIRGIMSGQADGPSELREQLEVLEGHAEGQRYNGRLETLEQLAALAYRLSVSEEYEESLGAMARRYVTEHSFADALREQLAGADLGPALGAVAEEVLAATSRQSDERNARFASLLADDLRDRRGTSHGLPIQDALGRAIAPATDTAPVLMVVLDGLNWAVARWLFRDGVLEDWERWCPDEDGELLPMFATVPSETKYSRTSLLTGELQPGNQSTERKDFADALQNAGGVDGPESVDLFHKAELDADGRGQVSEEVEASILNDEKCVVGVVVNAIDDQLSGAEQLDVEWSVDAVTPLRSLLELARNRIVIIAGDHGHVWESGTEYSGQEEASRWRQATGEIRDGEQACSGPMIRELTGDDDLVAAASERIRYGRGNRGYHGGMTMQEIITPLVALVPSELELDLPGYRALPEDPPDWWKLQRPTPVTKFAPESDESPQMNLLGGDTEWIRALIETDQFDRRLDRYGTGLSAQQIGETLAELTASDGYLALGEFADVVGLPRQRARRRITALKEILNVEGYASIRFNRAEERLELDEGILKRQFGLKS